MISLPGDNIVMFSRKKLQERLLDISGLQLAIWH